MLEGLGERRHPRRADRGRELLLEPGQDAEPAPQRRPARPGPPDPLGASIGWVRDPLDHARRDQLVDERGDRLLGHLEPPGDLGQAHAVGRDVREQLGVRQAQPGLTRALDVRDRALVDQPRGAKQQLERRSREWEPARHAR